MGFGRGNRGAKARLKLSTKKVVFLVSSEKKFFSPLLAPLEKRLEKSNSGPSGKIPSNAIFRVWCRWIPLTHKPIAIKSMPT